MHSSAGRTLKSVAKASGSWGEFRLAADCASILHEHNSRLHHPQSHQVKLDSEIKRVHSCSIRPAALCSLPVPSHKIRPRPFQRPFQRTKRLLSCHSLVRKRTGNPHAAIGMRAKHNAIRGHMQTFTTTCIERTPHFREESAGSLSTSQNCSWAIPENVGACLRICFPPNQYASGVLNREPQR